MSSDEFVELNNLDNRFLRVEMSDGSWWEIPAKIVCFHALDHLNIQGNKEKIDFLSNFIKDDDKIIDWAEGNMSWEDVKTHGIIVRHIEKNYKKDWKKGMKWIVNHD